ncbi:MAG: acyl-CoA synthetase (AMP-forming)/AMP-acid ligase II [Flavobacteriaceae bacterium]|jgi:acyl-CoA synthetase (AMP-forming)/AMP-acid ligase II
MAHIAFHGILDSLERHPDRIAIIDKNGQSYTYGEFKQYITGARAELVKRGVVKGSKVLVFVPMSMELYALLEALFSLGATAIFLDPWMKGKKMGSVIKQVEPDLFIVTKKIARFSWLLSATWKLKKWKLDTINPSNDDWIIDEVSDLDNALITFTSGTSGKPKGANRTFAFLYAQASTLEDHLKGNTDDACVDFTNFPIVGLADFSVGNTVVIPRINLMKIQDADSDQLVRHIHAMAVSRIIVSPSLLKKVVDGMNVNGHGAIEDIMTGGAPISNQLIKDCVEKHLEIKFEAIYGSTEAEPICLSPFQAILDSTTHPLDGVYVGVPVDDVEVCILNHLKGPVDVTYFESNQLSDQEIGEVVVTGEHVNKNYYKNKKAFEEAKIIDAHNVIWHRTGDMGYFKQGRLYLVGRDHRILEKDGKNIYPYPIEQEVEMKFGLNDVGYIQNSEGHFVMHLGAAENADIEEIKAHILHVAYPCDEVKAHRKALPRDARHKSKLLSEELA